MKYICIKCKKVISDKVYNYSKKHFKEPLCRDHQPNNKDVKKIDKKKNETPGF